MNSSPDDYHCSDIPLHDLAQWPEIPVIQKSHDHDVSNAYYWVHGHRDADLRTHRRDQPVDSRRCKFNGIIIHVVLKGLTNGNTIASSTAQVGIALLIGLAACIAVGLINGLLISKLKVPALLATLGMSTLLQGLSILITGVYLVWFPNQITWFGVGRSSAYLFRSSSSLLW